MLRFSSVRIKTVNYETLMKVMDSQLHQAGYLKIGLVGEETAKAK